MRAMRTLGALVGAVALGLSTVVASAATATAAPPEVVSEPYEYQSFECGYPIDVAGEFASAVVTRTRSPKEPDVFYFHGRLSFREVLTNPDTGAWFVIRGTWLEADVTAKLVQDNIYEYTVIQAGQPLVVEDSTGRVIARERGVLRYRLQWDTDGNFVDFLGVDVGGPHSSLDRCRYAADLIGMDNSTSSQRYTLRPDGTTDSPLGYAEYLPRRTVRPRARCWSSCTVMGRAATGPPTRWLSRRIRASPATSPMTGGRTSVPSSSWLPSTTAPSRTATTSIASTWHSTARA